MTSSAEVVASELSANATSRADMDPVVSTCPSSSSSSSPPASTSTGPPGKGGGLLPTPPLVRPDLGTGGGGGAPGTRGLLPLPPVSPPLPALPAPAVPPPCGVDFGTKHPLQRRWTLWYNTPVKKLTQTSWGDHIHKVFTFGTVEDFWSLYNNIMPPSRLASGSNYHLFREGVEPKWEDPANSDGGKWVVTLPKRGRESKEDIDDLWMYTVLAIIGETFDRADNVCGVVMSLRKQIADKLAVWTSNALCEDIQLSIGRQLMVCLEIQTGSLGYQVHSDSLRQNTSFNNDCRYEL